MAGELDGPRLEAKSGKAKNLVVFLHGYGADGNDLIDIGRAWQELLPDTAFVSPHAPRICGQSPTGREWFSLTFRDPTERWRGVQEAAPALNAFIDAERLHKIAEAWRPWRGVAAHLMWAYYHVVKRREGAPVADATKKTWPQIKKTKPKTNGAKRGR